MQSDSRNFAWCVISCYVDEGATDNAISSLFLLTLPWYNTHNKEILDSDNGTDNNYSQEVEDSSGLSMVITKKQYPLGFV